jgi:hypothetical protein
LQVYGHTIFHDNSQTQQTSQLLGRPARLSANASVVDRHEPMMVAVVGHLAASRIVAGCLDGAALFFLAPAIILMRALWRTSIDITGRLESCAKCIG